MPFLQPVTSYLLAVEMHQNRQEGSDDLSRFRYYYLETDSGNTQTGRDTSISLCLAHRNGDDTRL